MVGIWRDDVGSVNGAQSLRWGAVTIGKVQKWGSGPMATWTASCYLPGIRTTLGQDVDRESAVARVDRAVAKWCKMVGIEGTT